MTMGDPAGIGPELCLRVMHEPSIVAKCIPVLFGDASVLSAVARRCHLPEPQSVIPHAEWDNKAEVPMVVDCGVLSQADVRPGEVDPDCGRAAYTYIEKSIQSVLKGQVKAVITAPIHKEALRLANVPYPGHTEIFAALTGSKRVCLMLVSDEITVSFVTVHIGYAEVPHHLSSERILDVIELTAEEMRRLRGKTPRIGVCGLNPHAGEHGLFGFQEEEKLIRPALSKARAKGLQVEGPLSPGVAFAPVQRHKWDVVVCMYHDQGHIPFKMLAFDHGVNVTLGLPIVRTSVAHGTAFDIAWTGHADPKSMIQAVLLGVRLAASKPAFQRREK